MTEAVSNDQNADQTKREDRMRRYFSQFALRHLNALQPHRRFGNSLRRRERGLWEKRDGENLWRNVAEHCLVAGALSELLAELMHLSPVQIQRVTDAAILHDWYKKHETAGSDSG